MTNEITKPIVRPILGVKRVCDFLRYRNDYQKIPSRTWRKYKTICKVQPWSKEIDELTAIGLCAIADYKKIFSNANVTYEGLLDYLENREDLVSRFSDLMDSFVETSGEQLPAIIEYRTGKKISERSLYRISKNNDGLTFKRKKPYSPNEIENWVNYFKTA